MQSISTGPGNRVFWCPRCGSLKIESDANVFGGVPWDDQLSPMIVERVRRFHKACVENDNTAGEYAARDCYEAVGKG